VTSSPRRLIPHVSKPPLWARWLLTLLGFLVLILAIVVGVHAANDSSESSERTAALKAARESQILVEQDQAPHTAPLSPGTSTQPALQREIGADMANLIHSGQLPGPLYDVRCTPAGTDHSAHQAFNCTAQADGIPYPFVGVADTHARQLTWCKVDSPPVSGGPQEVPVSPRCRA
jgi:hypothetical protein